MIIIDGVVGCGKTTLAMKLGEKMNIPVYEELQRDDTMILLDKFYSDKKRWSFTLQIHFLNERFRMIKEISKKGEVALLDRSIFGDKIFATMLYEDGYMTKEEYDTYVSLLDNMLVHTTMPSKLIYLKCDVNTAVERIKKRNRTMELSTPIEYWERLNEKYDDWYDNYDLSEKLIIDAKSYDPNNIKDIENIIKIF